MTMQPDAETIVDLFCGCGGFTLGAELAGFRSIAAIDVDPVLQSGYRRNFPGSRVIEASVADLDRGAWRRILGDERPAGVIGGPPCQGFSAIGKRRPGDPRNDLVRQFVRQVNLLGPKYFVMENVDGILREENAGVLSSAFAILDGRYSLLPPLVLNASDCGAATIRRRVMIIGYDPLAMPALLPTMFAPAGRAPVTVREAIADLPRPAAEEELGEHGWARYSAVEPSSYARGLRTPPSGRLGSGDAVGRMKAGWVSGLTSTRHSPAISRRYASIQAGRSDPTTKSFKLAWDGQCPTLRAGTGPEKGAFQAVRPLHPGEGRVITVREAARLQGFPDWFMFHPTKWHSFRMIGNSVSPFVSRFVMERIHDSLNLRLAA